MNSQSAKLITTIVATVSAGIPIWTVSARDLNFTDPAFLAVWFLIGAFVSLLATLFSAIDSKNLIGAVTAGFTIALVIRYLADMFSGVARHSMLGAELLIAIGIGAVSAWIVTYTMTFFGVKKSSPGKKS
jgi:hypothetical protein